MKHIILKVGINGGESKVLVPAESYHNLEMGIDGNIRLIYKNGDRTYPIIEVLDAPDDFTDSYNAFKQF